MTRSCGICNHANRLEIDREVVEGKSLSLIARKYGINRDSLSNHAENHISRQLAKAWQIKATTEGMDLLGRIDSLVQRAEKIFNRNFEAGKDSLALKAIGEQRQTFDLLARISYALHQSRLAELELMRKNSGFERQQEEEQFQKQLEILSEAELVVLYKIQKKLLRQDADLDCLGVRGRHTDINRELWEDAFEPSFPAAPEPDPEEETTPEETEPDPYDLLRIKYP